MLASEVLTRVRDMLSDPLSTNSRWSDERIIRELNSAQSDLCRKARVLRSSIQLIAHSNQSTYTLPSDLLLLDRVLYNDKVLPFIRYEELDSRGNNWETMVGTPNYVTVSRLSRQLIRITPIPNFIEPEIFTLETVNYITIYYIKKPEVVLLTTDTLELDIIYKDALVYFITGSLLRADMDTQNRAIGNEQLQLYGEAILDFTKDSARDYTANASIFETQYRSF